MMDLAAARKQIFIALDVPDVLRARQLVEAIGQDGKCYKVGLELLFGGGIEFAQGLKASGAEVFLDMKLLDIANTVEKATANIANLGFDYLTVHGHDRKTLDAAAKGRATSRLKLLAVTVLTNLERTDLEQQGITGHGPADLVVHRAQLAQAAGFDGVIASGHEAALVRQAVGADFLIVTPGIRLPGGDVGDQARVMTPETAIAQGATHLVVGRPITTAADPAAAARRFTELLASARIP
ncbi:MAG: orotidine-5'-phosphate decarboxylase [Hyphomicrobiaceae bacterium]